MSTKQDKLLDAYDNCAAENVGSAIEACKVEAKNHYFPVKKKTSAKSRFVASRNTKKKSTRKSKR